MAAKTVASFLKGLRADRRKALTALRRTIKKAAPRARESIEGGVPVYRLNGELLCAMASRAQYLAFYACNTKLLPRHKKKLKGLNCGKSCIRFKRLEQLPMEVIRDVVKEAARALKRK